MGAVAPSPPWALLGFISVIALFMLATITVLAWVLYRGVQTQPDMNFEQLREVVGGIPVATVLGVAALGMIAAICVTGVAYGLSVGQTGSIETIQAQQTAGGEETTSAEQPAQNEQIAQEQQPTQGEPTTPGQPLAQDQQTGLTGQTAQINAGTIGVVSSSQGLGILATIASAAVGGIAGVMVQQRTQG